MLLAGQIFGQSKEAAGKIILDRAVRALGGDAYLNMKDRIETGRVYSFYRQELRGLSRARIYTRYLTPADKPTGEDVYIRERQSFGKEKEDYAILFDESKGWSITFRGAAPLPADTLSRFRDSTRRNILYFLRQRRHEPGLIIEHMGTEIIDNVPVDAVAITDEANITLTVYFQKSTGLPVKQVFYRRDPATKIRNEETTVFAKYRAAGGVQWPFNILRIRNGEKVFEIFSESVAVNQDFDDSFFTIPADIKILPPPK
jgi:hypothetical protein